MAAMAISVASVANINSLPDKSDGMAGFDSAKMQTLAVDEDDSSMSSTATDGVDRNSSDSSTRTGQWRFDTEGNWRRYGSTESATSTGISSICSSTAVDDRLTGLSTQSTPSRKRMYDGALKQPSTRTTASPHAANDPHESVTAASITAVPSVEQKVRKRRGRPPKDKSKLDTAPAPKPRARRASEISQLQDRIKPRSAIPTTLPKQIFASQCIEAAHASRLDPYSLHPAEHKLLADLLMHNEVTVYLNIRNAILRLWIRNPLCSVTAEEAAGCAKEGRFFGLAEVAYKWLARDGYINFGCVEVPKDHFVASKVKKLGKAKTVVVIGAGVSGLTAARQLENLFAQSPEKWTDFGEAPPRVVVVEGRKRIGGRVYSKPLRSQVIGSLPDELRNTAEMGAMIVTGFEHGNPLDTIIRGQLGLRYHMMTDELTIYDCNGTPVDEQKDTLNTELYTDISDRTGSFRATPRHLKTLRGDDELISRARDPTADGYQHLQLEPHFDPIDPTQGRKPATRRGRRRNAPPGTEKLTGRSRVVEESGATQSAARAAKTMGWQLKEGTARNQSISLLRIANASMHPTLGTVMDEAIEQYQDIVDLTPQDMRLLNWHHANLEYANAAPVSSLSLSGHDQDTGNEFEGAHSEIIGGYTQLPRGLMNLPTKLDVRLDRIVESIHYNKTGDPGSGLVTKVVCTDGEVIEADELIITAPLGVLKTNTVDFDPPLPGWKRGAIDRMGFGLLNKVILLYDQPFWDDSRDMFGLLNEAGVSNSLNPLDYAEKRGRFYLIWNASKISGRPMLVALMAGNAAHAAEKADTHTLLCEINERLRHIFKHKHVPAPLEIIVTRWKRDPFTRGTYSFVAPETRSGDYDLISKPVGNLHFAGEATCGTHPATVHGAFLSGLRVAAEVMEAMAGPVTLPTPLVGIKPEMPTRYTIPVPLVISNTMGGSWDTMAVSRGPLEPTPLTTESGIKQEPGMTPLPSTPAPALASYGRARKASTAPRNSVCAADSSFWVQPSFQAADLNLEAGITCAILTQIGERPCKPARQGVNPFLLYTKARWEQCKAYCAQDGAGAGRDAIRQTLGRWWKALAEAEKRPYLVQSQQAQELADGQRKEYERAVAKWDEDAKRIRGEYVREHSLTALQAGPGAGRVEESAVGVSKRKTNVSNCVVLDHA